MVICEAEVNGVVEMNASSNYELQGLIVKNFVIVQSNIMNFPSRLTNSSVYCGFWTPN